MVDWWRVYLGRWWSAQSDLQRKLKFHCNWWTWWKETECCLEHCKSACLCNPCLNIYNNFERWHHVDFHLFVLQLFVTKAVVFIFLNSRDIFVGECPSFRIPRMFRFWSEDCTYSAPRGATKMKTWTSFFLIEGFGRQNFELYYLAGSKRVKARVCFLLQFREFVDSF